MQTSRSTARPRADLPRRESTGADSGLFSSIGYLGPLPILTAEECRRVLRALRRESAEPAPEWPKGHAAASALFHELGTRAAILDPVCELIGENVMLWGASVVVRHPGQIHSWHSDIETAESAGRAVSVWIGLENTDRHSSLRLLTRSHRFGISVQERAAENDEQREETAAVLAWAQERDPQSVLVEPDMSDGDALFFDGGLWHGSANVRGKSPRSALLLQYASPDTLIRIPSNVRWPFRYRQELRPPCLMVRGADRHAVNRIVPAPPVKDETRPELSTWIGSLELPLEQDEERGWKPHGMFGGSTPNIAWLGCHVSVLNPGVTPHPPHRHTEEELLVILDGEAELILVDDEGGERRQAVGPGWFSYYPADQRHTLRGAGCRPVTYLMFKWTGEAREKSRGLETTVFDYAAPDDSMDDRAFLARGIFEGNTRYLSKLHAHATTLAPGGGYAEHVDEHDVAILVREGTVETVGRRVGPHGLIFYPAGESHGMKNVGDTPARYLVFEFHN